MRIRSGLLAALVILAVSCGGGKPAASNETPAGKQAEPAKTAEPAQSPQPAEPVKGEPARSDAAKAEPPKAETITLPAGTVVQVRTGTTISTKLHKPGAAFTATLAQPLAAGGVTVAAKGALVQGVVASSDPGGRVKGRASLSVRLTSIESPSGSLKVATNLVGKQAPGTKKRDAAKIGAGAGIGAAIGAIAGGGAGAAIGAAAGGGAGTGVVLATRGAPAEIPAESLLSFRLRAPVSVTLAR